jgi:hypothetical protein
MNPLKNNTQRAKGVNIIFITFLGINIITTVAYFLQVNLLHTLKSGVEDVAAATANDTRISVLGIAYLVILICTIVFFILWFRRAYYNLHTTQRVNLLYTEGWAAGSWFVPFLNLVRPYQIMKEIWDKTQQATKNLLDVKGSAWVGWWWALYLISNVASNVANKMYNDDSTYDTLLQATYAQIFANCIEIPAIIITILMVKKTAAMEARLFQQYDEPIDETEDLIGEFHY